MKNQTQNSVLAKFEKETIKQPEVIKGGPRTRRGTRTYVIRR